MTTGTSIGTTTLVATARELVDTGRGFLAADESVSTMSKRLEQAGVAPTETNRRDYRELLVATPGLSDGASGVILCDETPAMHGPPEQPRAEGARPLQGPPLASTASSDNSIDSVLKAEADK